MNDISNWLKTAIQKKEENLVLIIKEHVFGSNYPTFETLLNGRFNNPTI